MKIALITGITGQDGAYLADLLLKTFSSFSFVIRLKNIFFELNYLYF